MVGLARPDDIALVEQLRVRLHQDRSRDEHRWTVGDIVYWDNQATLHARSAFDSRARRVLKRVSLARSRPF